MPRDMVRLGPLPLTWYRLSLKSRAFEDPPSNDGLAGMKVVFEFALNDGMRSPSARTP